MSVRRSVRKLSLMIPVCHARAARGGTSRCADGRVGIGEVVEREWSRAERVWSVSEGSTVLPRDACCSQRGLRRVPGRR